MSNITQYHVVCGVLVDLVTGDLLSKVCCTCRKDGYFITITGSFEFIIATVHSRYDAVQVDLTGSSFSCSEVSESTLS